MPSPGAASDAPPPPHQFPTGTNNPDPSPRTRPFILCHGLDGFKNIGPIDYFYGVADLLRKAGYDVYTPQVDAYNSSEVRGEELLAFVKNVLEQTRADKVNLICHSQGGLDCRYVASLLGDRISSVTTLSTPHRGTPLADIAVGDLPGPLEDAVTTFLNLFGAAISQKPDMNAQAAMQEMTTAGAAQFTTRHPDDPRVAYFSIAGRSGNSMGQDTCATSTAAAFVERYDQYADPFDPLLAAAGAILSNAASPPPSNDGLVPVGSARWGTFLGCVPADHMEEICQFAGAKPGGGNPFDCHLFYRQLADWIVAQGY